MQGGERTWNCVTAVAWHAQDHLDPMPQQLRHRVTSWLATGTGSGHIKQNGSIATTAHLPTDRLALFRAILV